MCQQFDDIKGSFELRFDRCKIMLIVFGGLEHTYPCIKLKNSL